MKSILLILFFSVNAILIAQSGNVAPNVPVGYKLFEQLTVEDINGQKISIGDSTNAKYTLIDFYFNACGPCNANIPKLKALQKKHVDKLNIVTVNYIDGKAAIIEHIKKYETNFIDLYGDDAKLVKAAFPLPTQSMGFPYYILLDASGKVLYSSLNSMSWHKKISRLIK